MESFLNDIIQIQKDIIDDFVSLIKQYGQKNHLYIKEISAEYIKNSNIVEYYLTHNDIIAVFEDENGKHVKEKFTQLSIEEMSVLYESTYIFLMMTQYNAKTDLENPCENQALVDIENLISESIGKKAVVDMYEEGNFEACDDLLNHMEMYEPFCINKEDLDIGYDEDEDDDFFNYDDYIDFDGEYYDDDDEYMEIEDDEEPDDEDDEENDDDFDINDIKGMHITQDGDTMHIDFDDEFGEGIGIEPEYITFEIIKNKNNEICIACYSEDDADMPHMEIPVNYMQPFEAMYYYDFIMQHEAKD